jgi:3-oxoadipate enol-lactonase
MPTLERDTHRIYYEFHNPHDLSTRPLVLLHGLGSSGEDWFLQRSHFSKYYPILTLDLRGHGRSSMGTGWPTMGDLVIDVVAMLEEVGCSSAHILGLSLGGAVALQLALDFPDLVYSLTSVNSFARLRISGRGWVRSLGRLFLLLIGRMDLLGTWIAAGIFPDPGQEAWREAAAARIGANPRESYLRAMRAVMRFDVTSRLQEIRVPTLIVAGERDKTIALEAKEFMAESIPGARMVRFPDSGHGTPYDAADRFYEVVMDFLLYVEQTRQGEILSL